MTDYKTQDVLWSVLCTVVPKIFCNDNVAKQNQKIKRQAATHH